jgi:hypothetical protein
LPRLKSITLRETAVTDMALEHLAKAPNLCYLNTEGTKVTLEGIRSLLQARPDLWQQRPHEKIVVQKPRGGVLLGR